MGTKRKAASDYKKLTFHEHVLLRPELYIGSMTPQDVTYQIDRNTLEITTIKKQISDGFQTVFREIINNAIDQIENGVSKIKISINSKTQEITITSIGVGIPNVKHPQQPDDYIVEVVFYEQFTSENYDDDKKRINVIGQNGLGSKGTNLFSQYLKVENVDDQNIKLNKVWSANATRSIAPKVTQLTKPTTPYVKVQFKIDCEKFGLPHDFDYSDYLLNYAFMLTLSVSSSQIDVYIDNKKQTKSFKATCKSIYGDDAIYSNVIPNCEICLYDHLKYDLNLNFVNRNPCPEGGTHVNKIYNLIQNDLKNEVTDQKLKSRIGIAINYTCPNPKFTSQNKVKLSSKTGSLFDGTKFKLPIAALKKTGYYKSMFENVDINRAQKVINERKQSIKAIDKLEDANNAGKAKRKEKVVLQLTEGDSAKKFGMSGFSVLGRDNYGLFPLKGKPINLQKTSNKKDKIYENLKSNVEMITLCQILGINLKTCETLTSTKSLRYDEIWLLMDSDGHGSHIAALVINNLNILLPNLLKTNPNFIKRFSTYVVITNQNPLQGFRTMKEYEDHLEENPNINTSKHKYIKGLGGNSKEITKTYYKNVDKHLFAIDCRDEDHVKLLNILLSGDAQLKLKMLSEYIFNDQAMIYSNQKKNMIDLKTFLYIEFFDHMQQESLHKIPNLYDGLCTTARKIIYLALVKQLSEMKVAQFASEVASVLKYLNGESSMCGAVDTMACDASIIGNVISFLKPKSHFGDRHDKKAASPRYTFVELNKVSNYLFRKEDIPILKYEYEEGVKVEPKFLMPILPTLFINGSEGNIGVGISANFPTLDLDDVIHLVKNWIDVDSGNVDVDDPEDPKPIIHKYTGKIKDGVFHPVYTLTKLDDDCNFHLHLTDLPKESKKIYTNLKEGISGKFKTSNFINNSTDDTVDVNLDVHVLNSKYDFEKDFLFKTCSKHVSFSNMNLWIDDFELPKHFNDVREIINEFCEKRLEYYKKRQEYEVHHTFVDLQKLKFKLKFIVEELETFKKIEFDEMITILDSKNYYKDENDSYNYIFNQNIKSLSKTQIHHLEEKIKTKEMFYEELKTRNLHKLWLDEIDEFSRIIS